VELTPENLKQIKAALGELGPGLDAQNALPNPGQRVTAGIGDGVDQESGRRYLSATDQVELRERIHKMSDAGLGAMFSSQARKKDQGIPVDLWMSAGGGRSIEAAIERDPFLAKALDTGGAAALIRQDLEPILYELYIRQFPAWERFRKEPANGLVHAYNRATDFGDAQFMTELGTVTDDTAAYERATTPVAVIATRRGVSLKSQYATLQGGAGFNPEQLEMQAGLRAIAHKMQKTIFQGNATVSSGVASDENGAYDANGFDGLRRILNSGDAEDCDPTGSTPDDIREVVNTAAITAMQNAGRVGVAYLDPIVKGQIDVQQDKNVRYMNSFTEVNVGVMVNALNTVFGPTPLFVVPGDSIGEYTHSAQTVSDIYLLDEQTISLPYLGSDGPTVLDIPMGVSGQLTHLFILFGMWGLAVKTPTFSNKVRVRRP
jgi:hypothetical protein